MHYGVAGALARELQNTLTAFFPRTILILCNHFFILKVRLVYKRFDCWHILTNIYSFSDNKMLSIIFIPAVFQFLLTAEAGTTPTDKCDSVISNTCYQQCNSTSCNCAASVGKQHTDCNQACGTTKCKEITCSSGTCYQKCHDCRMECTSDVDYCNQQCLSGACSFKCSAKKCVQECGGKTCKHLPSDHDEPFIPRLYLVILAGLFASTTILTCLALVISCRQMGCRRRRPAPLVPRDLGSSVRSLPTKSSIV